MAKVRIKASAEAIAKGGQDRGDFVVPKPGFYILQLTECNPGFSKDADGNEDKKKPRLECIYKIVGVGRDEEEPKENYGNVWDYVSFSENSEWKRGEFLKAFGFTEDGNGDFDDEIDTDDVINRKVLVRLKHEKQRGKDATPRAKVASMFVYGTDPSEIVDDGGVSYGDAEDEPEDAFGSVDDEPQDEGYTEEELAGMDLKALGAILTDLGGVPQDHIVKKGKGIDSDATKAAVIAAILEEQSGDEEGADDPF